MAGPCVSIFTPQKTSPVEAAKVGAMIRAIAGKIEGDDFWITGRPFFIKIRKPEPEDRALVLDGWSPRGQVSFCAMCNDLIDHILLAVCCCRTAEILDGLIALDDLSLVTQVPSVLTQDGRFVIEGHGDFVTARFLANWMGSPEFRLVK